MAILLVGAGVYGALYYYETHTGLALFVKQSESILPTPVATSTNPTMPIGPVAITGVTSTSITVRVNDKGDTITYGIGTSTHVYSLALEGKAGKTFNDLAPDVLVTIYPQPGDSSQAIGIAFKRDPALVPSKEDTQNSVAGVVSMLTSDMVTITPASGAPVSITLDPSIKMYTTVIEGQTGRPLAKGEQVVATGVSTAGDLTTAKMILLAPKVSN